MQMFNNVVTRLQLQSALATGSHLTYPVQLSYLGKLSKARNGKLCLKLQILFMLAYL